VVKAPIEEDRSTTTRISPRQGQFAEDPPHATATACIGSRAGAQVSHQIKHFAEKVAGHLDLPRYRHRSENHASRYRVHYDRASHTATKYRYDL
jgi:hypothetical protein